jgi:hypothetical protein
MLSRQTEATHPRAWFWANHTAARAGLYCRHAMKRSGFASRALLLLGSRIITNRTRTHTVFNAVRISDIEDRFTCTVCGKRGADGAIGIRTPLKAMGYR